MKLVACTTRSPLPKLSGILLRLSSLGRSHARAPPEELDVFLHDFMCTLPENLTFFCPVAHLLNIGTHTHFPAGASNIAYAPSLSLLICSPDSNKEPMTPSSKPVRTSRKVANFALTRKESRAWSRIHTVDTERTAALLPSCHARKPSKYFLFGVDHDRQLHKFLTVSASRPWALRS